MLVSRFRDGQRGSMFAEWISDISETYRRHRPNLLALSDVSESTYLTTGKYDIYEITRRLQ